MISNTVKNLIGEDKIKTDLYLIRNLVKILSVLLLIFTIIFFTCFGCFLVLNDSTSWAAQTVTLSSEGGVNETYPDSMGEYQLAGEIYRLIDMEDRFLIYNSLGNIVYLLWWNFIILTTDYRWYISKSNYTENVEGAIRSNLSGPLIYPELQWEYHPIINITQCNTARRLIAGKWDYRLVRKEFSSSKVGREWVPKLDTFLFFFYREN